MDSRIFTLDEMNRALPLIQAIVADVRQGYERLHRELTALGLGRTDPDLDDRELLRSLPWDLRDLVDEIRDWIGELEELGVLLRDPETGLVEAFGERDGEVVFYSWQPGEDRVRYWHELSVPPDTRRPVHALA